MGAPQAPGWPQQSHAEQEHPAPAALPAFGETRALCLYPHHEKQEVVAWMLSKVSPASQMGNPYFFPLEGFRRAQVFLPISQFVFNP